MSLEMDSLEVGEVLRGEFLYATVQLWPHISRCASSCGFCSYLNEGFIISDGKNTFVGMILFLIRILNASG